MLFAYTDWLACRRKVKSFCLQGTSLSPDVTKKIGIQWSSLLLLFVVFLLLLLLLLLFTSCLFCSTVDDFHFCSPDARSQRERVLKVRAQVSFQCCGLSI